MKRLFLKQKKIILLPTINIYRFSRVIEINNSDLQLMLIISLKMLFWFTTLISSILKIVHFTKTENPNPCVNWIDRQLGTPGHYKNWPAVYTTHQLKADLYRANMFLLVLSLTLTCTFALKNGHDDHEGCVDISYYDPVQFNVTTEELCSYKMKPTCVKKQQTICKDIPVHSCKIEGYVDCKVS